MGIRPNQRDFLLFLHDIVSSIEKINVCIEGVSDSDALESDWMRYDAVLRNLEIVGEAVNKLPANIKEQFPEVPWDDMYRTRNIISHYYFGIDSEIIWRIATLHLPENLAQIKDIIRYFEA